MTPDAPKRRIPHILVVTRLRVRQRTTSDHDRLPMTSRATHAPYSNWGRSKVALHLEIRPQTRRKLHARGEYQQTPTRQRASPPNVTSQDRKSPLFTTTPFESDSPQGGKASPCPPWGRILTHISYKLESLDLVPVEPSNDRSTRADYLKSGSSKGNSIAEARTELGRSGFAHRHGRRHGHDDSESGREFRILL